MPFMAAFIACAEPTSSGRKYSPSSQSSPALRIPGTSPCSMASRGASPASSARCTRPTAVWSSPSSTARLRAARTSLVSVIAPPQPCRDPVFTPRNSLPASYDALEVDEAPFHVGGGKLDAHTVADIEPFEPGHQLALDRRVKHAHPRPLGRSAGGDRVEALP